MSASAIPISAIDHPSPEVSALTPAETAVLGRMAKGGGWLDSLWVALLGGGLIGGLAYLVTFLLWRWFGPVDNPWQQHAYFQALGWIVGICVFVLFLFDIRRARGNWEEHIGNLRKDARAGTAHSIELDIIRAVEIEEYEDEGAGFFLELADGRVMCLISQDLYQYISDIELDDGEEDMRDQFPQTRIRYRYAPHSGTCLDISGIGESLRPFAKVKTTDRFFKKDKKTGERTYTGPEDGIVYEGPLEATLAAFKYKLKPL